MPRVEVPEGCVVACKAHDHTKHKQKLRISIWGIGMQIEERRERMVFSDRPALKNIWSIICSDVRCWWRSEVQVHRSETNGLRPNWKSPIIPFWSRTITYALLEERQKYPVADQMLIVKQTIDTMVCSDERKPWPLAKSTRQVNPFRHHMSTVPGL